MEKIVQREQETPAFDGRRMIDDFRLWGSRTWLQMAFHPFDGGGGNLAWKRSCDAQRLSLRGRSPRRCGFGLSRNAAPDAGQRGFPACAADKESEGAPRVSPLARRNGAPHERDAGGESDPTLFAAGAPRRRARVEARVETRLAPLCPPCGEVALTTMIPGGKAIGRCRGQGGSTGRSGFPTGGGNCGP